jgi:hypothetical protein
MSEVRELIDTEIDAVDVRELTDAEIDTVCGGGDFNSFNVASVLFQNAQAYGGNATSIF